MKRADCICEWSRGGMYIYFFVWVHCDLPWNCLFFVIWLSEYRICICFWVLVWVFLLQLSCSL